MQENKNLILAIVLCLLILMGWGPLAEYMGWVKPQPRSERPQTTTAQAPKIDTAQQTPLEGAPVLPVFTPAPGKEIKVDTPLYEAVFYTGGGSLRSFILKKFRSGIRPDSPLVNMIDEKSAAFAPLGLVINNQASWSVGQWSIPAGQDKDFIDLNSGADQDTLTVAGQMDDLHITRQFTFDANSYLFKEKISIVNVGEKARGTRIAFTQAMDSSIATGGQYDAMRVAWDENGSLEEESSSKTLDTTGVQAAGNIYWAGPMSTYFIAASMPNESQGNIVKGRAAGSVFRVSLEGEEIPLAPGRTREIEVSYWIGPKDRAEMSIVSDQLVKCINLGFFSGIGKCLLWLLEFFYKYVHNWGIAIILLTVVIKALFWPLTAKSYSSMEKMKQLNPLMQTLREKYKGDRDGLNKAVMGLYKTYKINPASGCVPILVQLPVFFGLYQALLSSLALRHASFITYLPGTNIIWLADLSAKDPLYITPIIMGLSMFVQQKMSPPPADPVQQKIMMFLPLIFTVLFINFPSGLVLYWLVNNILSILQQWLLIRKNKKSKPLITATTAPSQNKPNKKNK